MIDILLVVVALFALPALHASRAFNGPATIKTIPRSQVITADDGWHMFYFTDTNVLATPQFTICTNSPVLLRVTDAFCGGDSFGVYSNGTKIGSTVSRVQSGDCDNPAMRPEEAFFSASMSHVEVDMGAGAYGVNVLAERSPFGGGIGYVRVDTKDLLLVM